MEVTCITEDEAKTNRRDAINRGCVVSLVAYDPARDVYVFDIYNT